MNDLIVAGESQTQVTAAQEAYLLLGQWERHLHGEASDRYLDANIPHQDREKMFTRLRGLARQLVEIKGSPEGRSRAAGAIAAMFATGWPLYKFDQREEKVVAAYIAALMDFPIWAIESVCKSAGAGKLEDLRTEFPPSGARLALECDKLTQQIREEKSRFERLLFTRDVRLPVPPMTEAERAAAKQRYDDWKAGRAPDPIPEHEKKRQAEFAEWKRQRDEHSQLAEYARRGRMPEYAGNMLISPWLADNIRSGRIGDMKARKQAKDREGEGQQS